MNLKNEPAKYYVYLYIDPRDKAIKYVGKGTGWRVFQHGAGRGKSAKEKWFTELKNAGIKPQIDVLASNLTEKEAFLVERCVIDAIGIPPLTNAVRGHDTLNGRAPLKEAKIRESARPTNIQHKVVLFRISRYFKFGMSDEQIYEGTRGTWVIGEWRRERAQYAFGVADGIVRGVYEIDRWHKAGSTHYKFRPQDMTNPKRWEFTGKPAPSHILKMYLHTSVSDVFRQGAQNPVSYAGTW